MLREVNEDDGYGMRADTPALLDFLQKLYQFQTVAALSETVCQELPNVIAGENAIVCRHDGDRRIITAVVAKHPFSCANLMPHINESGIMAQHPFWENVFHPQQPVRALSEMTSRKQWHRNPLYGEVFSPDGIEDQINMEVAGYPACFTTVNVLRGKRGFSKQEHELMSWLRPHLAQAFVNAALAESAGLASSSPEHHWVAPVDMHGALIPDPSSPSFALPEPVRNWMAMHVRRFNEGWMETTVEPYKHEKEGQTWIFTLARDLENSRYLLAARHLNWQQIVAPLTPRESEILYWVAAGKTNDEIAAILETSVNTIKTHLKRSYVKLGVENRIAAVSAWRQKTSHPKG